MISSFEEVSDLDTQTIISELEAERDRLDQAINALQGHRRYGRRPGRKPRRHLTAAARKRISEGMKKRWGAAKKAGNNHL